MGRGNGYGIREKSGAVRVRASAEGISVSEEEKMIEKKKAKKWAFAKSLIIWACDSIAAVHHLYVFVCLCIGTCAVCPCDHTTQA